MNQNVISELRSIDWSFNNADTQKSVHGISKYPARMIPQIPENLIEIFKKHDILSEKDTIYDPFVGSGTTVATAKMNNLYSVGNDINPFAVYLSRVKTTTLSPEALETCLYDIETNILNNLDSPEAKQASDENINSGWFPQPQESQLLYIRNQLDSLEESYPEQLLLPFRIVLSTISRTISYQRNGEFKRYRIPEEDRKTHNPQVKSLFIEESKSILKTLSKFYTQYSNTPKAQVNLQDSRETQINEESIDAVISSSPYGDHSTTVAYGQFSRDPSIISFGKNKTEMLDVDKKGLGGKYSLDPDEYLTNLRENSETLNKTLHELEKVNGRKTDALEFFTDFDRVMRDVYRVLKPESPVCWVLANRTMSRTQIPSSKITIELAKSIGFNHQVTLPRDIPSKTLPWENAPENVSGQKGSLMADENIIILTK